MIDGLQPLCLDELTGVRREISAILDESPLLTEAFTL
jgi:ribosome maturation factor RimP